MDPATEHDFYNGFTSKEVEKKIKNKWVYYRTVSESVPATASNHPDNGFGFCYGNTRLEALWETLAALGYLGNNSLVVTTRNHEILCRRNCDKILQASWKLLSLPWPFLSYWDPTYYFGRRIVQNRCLPQCFELQNMFAHITRHAENRRDWHHSAHCLEKC